MIAVVATAVACAPENTAQEAASKAKTDDIAALGAAALAGWDAGAVAAGPGSALEDEARCAVYWEQWIQPISEGRTPEALIAAIPEQVREVPGGLTYRKLSERLMARFDRERVSPGDGLKATERWKPEAAAAVDSAIKGDRAEMQGLMQILATCSKA